MEEVDRIGVAAVLTAHAELQVRARGAAFLDRDADHAPDALGVDGLERGDAEDAQLYVAAEERAFHVVPGETPAHLGEIVGAEGEELGAARDLPRDHRGPGYLDHGPDQGMHRGAGLLLDLAEYLGDFV